MVGEEGEGGFCLAFFREWFVCCFCGEGDDCAAGRKGREGGKEGRGRKGEEGKGAI